jgi:hypothetical protein
MGRLLPPQAAEQYRLTVAGSNQVARGVFAGPDGFGRRHDKCFQHLTMLISRQDGRR